jgi:4-hydroxybenzoate polyprenyltransferase
MPAWQTSYRAILVAPSVRLLRHKSWQSQTSLILAPRRRFLGDYLQAIRPSTWIINALVFLPILWAPSAWGMEAFVKTYLAFCAFCLATSACSLLNDLADIRSDRQDSAKRGRALSCGQLSIRDGVLLAGLFLAVSGSIATLLSPVFTAIILAYVALALAYSLWLKRFLLVDLLILTGLCLAPVLWSAGAEMTAPSHWLMIFCAAFFFCLASLHRYVGLRRWDVGNDDDGSRAAVYTADDAPMVAALGIAAGLVSALVVALFAVSTQAATVYRSPELLWLLCPLLVAWTGKIWISAERGDVERDVITYAVSTPFSRIAAAAGMLIVFLARFVDINIIAGI